MFYLLVPDSTGVVNNNKRTKTQVITFTNGTVAHEYQHLINASRRTPRGNIDASMFSDPKAAVAYTTFEINNFRRYQTYLSRTETQAPVGFDGNDDDLQTRGAIWNFLRFAADHLP